jgi:phytanoyl-CoA hydroxylase
MNTRSGLDIMDLRERFNRDGFLVLPGHFSSGEADRVKEAMQSALAQFEMEIVVDDLMTGERTLYGLADKKNIFKINDLYLCVEEVRDLALEVKLSNLLRALLDDRRPVLCNTLTLRKGSNQPLHIDSLYMTPQSPHHLAATWIAFEDVDPDAGPLEYYSGSHAIPLFRFRDGSHHANAEEMPDWNEYILREVESRGLKKETFLARKGDVFIWHSDLLHGGSLVRDADKTRESLVCHYFTEDDCRMIAGLELEELNEGFWLKRLPQPVFPEPARFEAAHPFPEGTYLRRHSDVRAGVEAGIIASGEEHYRVYGFAEGRSI